MTRPWIAMLLVASCAGRNGVSTSSEYSSALSTETTSDGLLKESIDIDGDTEPDIFNFYRERSNADPLLVRKELDLNVDGQVDVISFFDAEGKLEREEMDGDFDGTFDWIDHYQDGRRVLAEIDTDHDGRTNVFAYYVDGSIARKERDTNGDGLIDYWERFDNEGNVVKTGKDLDGDGKMDVRDE